MSWRQGHGLSRWLLPRRRPELSSHHLALGQQTEISGGLHPHTQGLFQSRCALSMLRIVDEVVHLVGIGLCVVQLPRGLWCQQHLPLSCVGLPTGLQLLDVLHHGNRIGIGHGIEMRLIGHQVEQQPPAAIGNRPGAIGFRVHTIRMKGHMGSALHFMPPKKSTPPHPVLGLDPRQR